MDHRRSGDESDARARAQRALERDRSQVILLVDAETRIIWAAGAPRAIGGHDPQALIGRSAVELVHPDDLPLAGELFAHEIGEYGRDDLDRYREHQTIDLRLVRADGTVGLFEITGSNLYADPDVRGLVLVVREVSCRRLRDRALVQLGAGAPLAEVLETIVAMVHGGIRQPGVVTAVDRAGVVLASAGPGAPPTGTDVSRGRPAAGLPPHRWAHDIIGPAEGTRLGALIVWVAQPEPDPYERRTVRDAVALAAIAVERSQHLALLRRAAATDPLTGIPNRAAFDDRLARLETGSLAGPWTVLLVDLDGFKALNDSRGHLYGDQVLVEVAGRLGSAVRGDDLLARVGGDEFAVVGHALRSDLDAERLADRLLLALDLPIFVDSHPLDLTASVGVAVGEAGATAREVTEAADRALYDAKRAGKGQWRRAAPRGRKA
jgi:diguanylate cyclase (GGDEF)-like protein/PAS domain S-box-containing protein